MHSGCSEDLEGMSQVTVKPRGQHTVSVQGQIVNISGFVGHIGPVNFFFFFLTTL